MKKLLTVMTAASALAMAAPAAAQQYQPQYQGQYQGQYQTQANVNAGMGISNRIAQLQTRLQTGIQQGLITRQEAQSLRPQIRQLTQLERQYSRDGLSQQERQDLQQRLRTVRQQLRTADGGANGQYAQWENDNYAQGGPYEEAQVCENRSGLGGVISGIFGGSNNNCGLQVGQRVSGNLGSVPYEYRNQYRDGNGVLYRSDGRAIYQIDARTNTVVRVYGMNR
jgi:hypothetical protein